MRNVALVVGAVVAVALLVSTVAFVTLVRRPLPDYSGEVTLPGLSAEVTVLRGEHGVPQIYAATATDLFAAQGYVHAQDRFFEMDYRRHVASGRLSELVGDDDDAIAADSVIRTMGWRRVAEQELALLEPESRDYLDAYADGVNAYLRGRSPSQLSLAYTVLGVDVELDRIEEWDPVDSLAWLKALAWDLRANYEDEMGRALAFGAIGDVARVEQLWPHYPYEQHLPIVPDAAGAAAAVTGPARLDADQARLHADQGRLHADQGQALAEAQAGLASAAAALTAVPTLVGTGEGVGSNSWVVAGEHTETGEPLLANDPHLSPGMPSIWYQAGLHCTEIGPECPFDVAGFGFSGFPGVFIGHTSDVAWGFTNMGADVTDFFLERISDDEGTYLRDGEQVPLETRVETIRVAGGTDVEITVRSTVHGPVLSDVLPALGAVGASAPVPTGSPRATGGYDVALSWTALEPGRSADAVFAMNRATGWEEFRQAAALLEAPAQNIVYADTEGNIGYQAPGRIPIRVGGGVLGQGEGTWPRLGWSSEWDWQGWIPFEDLPSVRNPEEGFIVAANQAVVGPDYPYLLTQDWDNGYRSQRIRTVLTDLIAGGEKISRDEMAALQVDSRNVFAPVLVPALLAATLPVSETMTAEQRGFTREAVELLRGWDHSQPPDSAPAAYYNAVWAQLLTLTFADELPVAVLPRGGDRWYEVVRGLLQDRESVWWDDQTTPSVVENRDQVIQRALHDARLELTSRLGKDPERWQWGRLHTLRLEQSPLGGDRIPDPVRGLFNPDVVQLGGGTDAVLATAWDASSGDFRVTAVPSMRMVVDLGDLDASTWVDLTGVSGHPWSGHYADQLDEWTRGRQLPWPFTAEAVRAAAEDELTLRPPDQS